MGEEENGFMSDVDPTTKNEIVLMKALRPMIYITKGALKLDVATVYSLLLMSKDNANTTHATLSSHKLSHKCRELMLEYLLAYYDLAERVTSSIGETIKGTFKAVI